MQVHIIVNPVARRTPRPEALEEAARTVGRDTGWDIRIAVTSTPNEATAIARQAAADGSAAVFACGGDGTLNEVANGLLGTEAALGFIPAGTANLWAREHRIRRDPVAALRLLRDGVTHRADAGWAAWDGGERAFLLMAGVGYDGEVVRHVVARDKRLSGPLSFARAAIEAGGYHTVRAALYHDGLGDEGPLGQLIASNTRLYGAYFRPAPQALVDDGLLDITYVDLERPLFGALPLLPRLLLGRPGGTHVRTYRTGDLRVEPLPGEYAPPLQLDGEVVGEGAVRLTVRPLALRVIVPAGKNGLYAREAEPALEALLTPGAPSPSPRRTERSKRGTRTAGDRDRSS